VGKVTGFLEIDRQDRRYTTAGSGRGLGAYTILVLTFVLSLAVILLSPDSASACRAWRGWPTGDDLSKLRPGDVVVRAKLIESYRSEEPLIRSIMGDPYGMIFHIEITRVVGAASEADTKGLAGEKLYVLSPPSVCEHYRPHFVKDVEKSLVLNKSESGLHVIVGGQE
jgi:hypothetical protein